jgi:hypothetical protein
MLGGDVSPDFVLPSLGQWSQIADIFYTILMLSIIHSAAIALDIIFEHFNTDSLRLHCRDLSMECNSLVVIVSVARPFASWRVRFLSEIYTFVLSEGIKVVE